jgi:hypothetical protein
MQRDILEVESDSEDGMESQNEQEILEESRSFPPDGTYLILV